MTQRKSNLRRVLLGTLIMIFVIAAYGLWWSLSQPEPGFESDPNVAFQQTLNEFKLAYESTGPSKRQAFTNYYDAITPQGMLTILENSFPLCHTEGHELGMVVYQQTQDFVKAINICDHRCTGGCMHGVVLEAFSQNSFEELSTQMESFCKQAAIANRYKPGNCAHSLGHALMMTSGRNLDRSLEGCAGFPGEELRYYCATGVYMEHFNTLFRPEPEGGLHGPCDSHEKYPAACYRYKTTEMAYLLDNDWDQVIVECNSLPNRYRLGCHHGLGHGVRQAIMDGVFTVAEICGRGRLEDELICIEGVIEKWTDWNPDAAVAACQGLLGPPADVCHAAAQDGMYRLDKSTFNYYLAVE